MEGNRQKAAHFEGEGNYSLLKQTENRREVKGTAIKDLQSIIL